MKARVSAGRRSGRLLSRLDAPSKVAASGPCGVMHTCRLAPAPTQNPCNPCQGNPTEWTQAVCMRMLLLLPPSTA